MQKLVLVGIILCIIFTGVDAYSILEESNTVNRFFLKREVYPDHKYYYSGSEARPDAIIAIHKDYVLKSRFWKSCSITPDLLKNWVNNMTNNSPETPGIWGKKILGPNKEYLGVWFSPVVVASINLVGNKVSITTPR